MKRCAPTAVLAVLLLLLIGYLVYVELPREKGKAAADEKGKKIFDVRETDLTRLTLTSSRGEVSLEKTADGTWKIVRPVMTPADDGAVATIVARLTDLELTRVVEEKPQDLSSYGLAEPEIQVSMTTKDREERLLIGSEGPISSTLYLKKGGEERVLLSDLGIKAALDKDLQDLRRKEVVSFETQKVQRLTLRYPDHVIGLKKDNDMWFLIEPLKTKADRGEVSGLLSSVRFLTAQDFIDEKKEEKKKSFKNPVLTVSLDLEGREVTASFYTPRGKETGVYAVTTTEEPIYILKEDALSTLKKDITSLRDKEIVSFSRPDLKEIGIKTTQESYSLHEKDGTWVIGGEEKASVDQSRVAQLIDKIQFLRVEKFVDDHPKDLSSYGLDHPAIEITLSGQEKKSLGVLHLGKVEKGMVYAGNPENPTVTLVKKDILDVIPRKSDILTIK